MSIRTLLIISILLPLSVVYTISTMIETWSNRNEAVRHVDVILRELIAKHAAKIDGFYFAAEKVPETLANMLSVDETQNEEDFDAIIRKILASSPRLIGMCIAWEPHALRDDVERFAPYVHRQHSGSDELFSADLAKTYKTDYKTWDWYRIPKETGQGTWTEPYFDEGGGNILMRTYSVPLFRSGRFVGIVTVDVGLDDLREDMSRLSSAGIMYRLLSPTGTFIAAPEQEFVMKETIFSLAKKYDNAQLEEIGRDMLQGNSNVLPYSGIVNDRKVWLCYAPLSRSRGYLMASIPESQVLAPVYARLTHSIFVFFITLSVLSTLLIIVSFLLTAPIKRLAAFARKLAAGDLNAHVGDVRLAKEIDQLAHTLDKMVIDLQSNIERRIQEETARQAVERDLKAAQRIQESLLPRLFPPFPDRSEFDLYATCKPAAFVAGDFFDFFFIDPHTLVFLIADVSGHGIAASLFMAVSRTAIRNSSVPERLPHEIIVNVNQLLCADNDDKMFVTLFYGHYNTATGELTYVNAGHNPPYIVRKDGNLETLSATGPLVAAFEDISYDSHAVLLEVGDVLVTFTDGVTEAHSSQDNILYGDERLESLLGVIHREPVMEICDRIYREADQFAKHEQNDDITLLTLRRNE